MNNTKNDKQDKNDNWVKYYSKDDLLYAKLLMENEVLKNEILKNEKCEKQIHDPLNNNKFNSVEQIQQVINDIYNLYLSTVETNKSYMTIIDIFQKSNIQS